MKIGARTHDFGVGEQISFKDRLMLIKDAGYTCIQLAPQKAIDTIPNIHAVTWDNIEFIRGVLDEVGLEVSVLGCYIEPSIPEKEMRLRNVATFQRNLEFAKILKAPIVGTETTVFPMTGISEREIAYQHLLDSVKRMAETAEKEGVLIGMEPVAEHTMNDPEITRRLIDEVGSKMVKVIYDPSNLLLPTMVNQQQDVFKRTYVLLGDYVEAVHVKDFALEKGKKKMVALGVGVVDFPGVFAWLKAHRPDVPLLRENSTREYDAQDIAYIKKYW